VGGGVREEVVCGCEADAYRERGLVCWVVMLCRGECVGLFLYIMFFS
jgi:hypothetical protein